MISRPVLVGIAALTLAAFAACAGGEDRGSAAGGRDVGPQFQTSAPTSSPASAPPHSAVLDDTESRSTELESPEKPLMSAFTQECAAAAKAARTEEEWRAVHDRCISGDENAGEGIPLALAYGIDRATEDEIAGWWTLGELLTAPAPPAGSEEVFLAQASNGLQSDPRSEASGVFVIYQVSPRTVDNTTYFGLLDARAHSVRVIHHPPGNGFDPKAFLESGRAVTVRGEPGVIRDIRRTNGANADFLVGKLGR